MGIFITTQGSASWVATAATFLLLLFMHHPANAEIIEVRLKVEGGWLSTCTNPCDEDEYRNLSDDRLWVTFAYDTDLAGPDGAPLDPGLGEYGGNMGVGASVRLEGEVPFSFSCGLVDGKMTATPCTVNFIALSFVDASMSLNPNPYERDALWIYARYEADGKYLELDGHAWEPSPNRHEPFLNGDSVTQLPLPRPNFHIFLGSANLVEFGTATRWFEDESAGSRENSVSRDAGSPGLTLSKSLVAGCKGVIGRVTLSEPAPVGGTIVTISDTLASAKSPATVKIREGATSNYFTISTTPVAMNQDGMVSAGIGSAISDQPLTLRPMGLSAVKLSPTTVVGGHDAIGTATIECAAGPGPVTVDLSTSNAAVASPLAPTVVVPQGLQSQTFTVATNPVLSKSSAMITGEASTTTKSRRLNVVPAAVVSPTRLAFGSVSVGQTSGALTTILRNNGVVPFAVTGINLTGTYASWFAQSHDCPASLSPGASCTISVTFTPQAALSKSAKLSIATSATTTPLSVSMSATGI